MNGYAESVVADRSHSSQPEPQKAQGQPALRDCPTELIRRHATAASGILTRKLSGRLMPPEQRRERTIFHALVPQQITPHGPLQRLLDAAAA